MNLHAKASREYPVVGLCRLFGVTKQAYYKYDGDTLLVKVSQESFVIQYIRDIRKKDPGLGCMKHWQMYRRTFGDKHAVGRDRFGDIVDRYGLKVRFRFRKARTTASMHGLPVYPNLIKDFIPDAPNQLWVSDIPYITVWLDAYNYVFCYLSLVLAAYTEESISWSAGSTLEAMYPMEALRKALRRIEGKDTIHLPHHSDRVCPYASKEYVSVLKRHGIRISMTGSGDPKENVQAEGINGTMKHERLKDVVFRSIKEVQAAVNVAVAFYTNERPHMSIDLMTPSEVAHYSGEISSYV
jgi:transposase InsO family protein